MQILTPTIIMLAQTQIDPEGLKALLRCVGSNKFEPDQVSGSEQLVEVSGRLCYKSFEVGLNKNVTKIREGNKEYIKNILSSKHGSVLEHGTVTFAFMNVSRIFTHEVVRHRVGTAFSQESMRYVRMDNIGMYYPDVFQEEYLSSVVAPIHNWHRERVMPKAHALREKFETAVRMVETAVEDIISILKLDGVPFSVRKALTSAIRRIAPGGHTTNIIMTANHRAWRHICELRTDVAAEEEIRKIFIEVAQQLQQSFPNIYQDMYVDTPGIVRFGNSKV